MEDRKVTEPQLTELEPVKPCPHMKGLLNRMAEGSLSGLLLWYTKYHAAHCPDCNKTLHALSRLINRLCNLKPAAKTELPTERWQNIEDQWKEAEEAALKR